MASVIVFGPTGQAGSVAARTAANELGAKVWLAMRDTNKAISGLNEEEEKAGQYQRVQADLFKPETVREAVETSGAKRAFIYVAHGSEDHMRAAITALKAGGIEFVVFLSSFTILVDREKREIPPSEVIAYAHAQVEANLDDVFGEGHYVAVRCGCFVTNLLMEKAGIAAGKVAILNGGVFEQDNITPEDIGSVMGHILVNGPKNGQQIVYIYGSTIRSRRDSILEIGRILGRKMEVTSISPEEDYQQAIRRGLPEAMAKYSNMMAQTAGPDKGNGEIFPCHQEGVNNIKRYLGRAPQSLEEWAKANKAMFDA